MRTKNTLKRKKDVYAVNTVCLLAVQFWPSITEKVFLVLQLLYQAQFVNINIVHRKVQTNKKKKRV